MLDLPVLVVDALGFTERIRAAGDRGLGEWPPVSRASTTTLRRKFRVVSLSRDARECWTPGKDYEMRNRGNDDGDLCCQGGEVVPRQKHTRRLSVEMPNVAG